MRSLLCCAALAWVGCDRPTPSTAQGAFRLFSDAVRRHDQPAAYALLSGPTKAALEAQAKVVAAASAGSVKDDPADLTFLTNRRARPLLEVALAEETATRVVLAVKTCREPLDEARACPPGQDVQEKVTMVKEADRWLVELPEVKAP